MGEMNRRRWLESMGIIAAGSALPKPDFSGQLKSPEGSGKMRLDLSEFEPKSMLHVPETKVSRSKYPVIDIHTHLSIRAKSDHGVGIGEKMEFLATPESVLPVMDRKNIKIMVNLTGGSGKGLEEAVQRFQQPHPDRFLTFTEPSWDHSNQPDYGKFQARARSQSRRTRAQGAEDARTVLARKRKRRPARQDRRSAF